MNITTMMIIIPNDYINIIIIIFYSRSFVCLNSVASTIFIIFDRMGGGGAAAIVMLYPTETNKIVKHGDNIHVICHFHSNHFIYICMRTHIIFSLSLISER